MDVMTYSDTRANLKAVMDRVVADHAPVIVARQNGKPVVLVSLEDWEALEETMYVLSTPSNAARLLRSKAQVEAGQGTERALIEP